MRMILLCTALLSGCGTLPANVSIPVAVSCVPANAPTMPAVTENADLAKLDDRALVLRIAAERLDLLSFGVQAEMILLACK